MGILDFVITSEEVDEMRKGKPILKQKKTRLEETVDERKLTTVDAKQFKAEVWTRDKGLCRHCGRKVRKTIERVPERGEVHHIHGRGRDLRFDSRAACLLCLSCHEKTTGKAFSAKLLIVPGKTFKTRQGTFTDARHPMIFREAL